MERRSYDEIPPRVEYSLTEKGASVVPILQSICQWAGLSVRLARRWSLRFPKRSMPLNRCSSLAASFFVFIPSLSCSFAMRHTRSCPAALLDQHSVCIILGTLSVASLRYFPGEYHLWRWVFNFQGSVQNKYLLDFCAAVHYTELIFRHSFQRFCSCLQRQNLKKFIFLRQLNK